jgi:hypothetical protein
VSPVRQPTLPHLLLLQLRASRCRCAAPTESGHDERGVAVLTHLGDATAGAHGLGVHPVQRACGVGALSQHGCPERVHRPELEREYAAGRAGEQAHQHPMLLRAWAVEPPVHIRVLQATHVVHVAALQHAVLLLHHRFAARRLCLRAIATDDGTLAASQLGQWGGRRLRRAIRVWDEFCSSRERERGWQLLINSRREGLGKLSLVMCKEEDAQKSLNIFVA